MQRNNSSTKIDHQTLVNTSIFSHPLFNADKFSRSLARIIYYTFFIVLLGVVVACFISDIQALRWAGVLMALIIIDYLLHSRSAPYSVRDFFAGNIPSNNLALCVDKETLHYIISAFERAQGLGANLPLSLLASLLDKTNITQALGRLDISPKDFRKRIEIEIERIVENKDKKDISQEDLLDQLKKILFIAALTADFHTQHDIKSETLFSAIAQLKDSLIEKTLDIFSVTGKDIDGAIVFSRYTQHKWKIPLFTGGFAIKSIKVKPHRVNRTFTSRPTPVLDRFSRDVTDLARMGVEGFLIGHKKEYEEMIDSLSRQGSRNVLLIGEPGVGKESLVSHLAFNIISDNVPAPLFDRRLVELSIGNLVSGASYQELSSRLSIVVKEIVSAGNIILYIPEIHQLAKTADGNTMELSDILMPIIKSDAFPVIGATYPKEYKEFIEQRSDFANTFSIVRVGQITSEESITLLTYDAIIHEKQYGVRVNFSAIKQAVVLAEKYFRYKPLPASARDVFKEAISTATQRGLKEINGQLVIEVVERKINVPIHKTGKEEARALLNLEDTIHKTYVDQEEAVSSVADALRAYRSGLARQGGPIATFLFVGPTGVGKTELSKILSTIQFGSEKYMVRFDMSEYQEKDSVSRLIGSSDGRIAGALTEGIIQRPYSLILLDEFEKAHPDILNLFLQVFDDGRITDSLSRVVDFTNTIIIATSNAHSVYIQDQISSGRAIHEFIDDFKKKLFDYFKPELINRFSDVVVFKPLSKEDIGFVARLNLENLSRALEDSQGISIAFDHKLVSKISSLGYDPSFGARPLRKAIDENIKSVLAKKILSGDVSRGQTVTISVDDNNKIIFETIN